MIRVRHLLDRDPGSSNRWVGELNLGRRGGAGCRLDGNLFRLDSERGNVLKCLIGIALFIAFFMNGTAGAHDTWLLPRSLSVAPQTEVQLDMTSGMEFPVLDYAIEPDRIADAKVRLAGKTVEIPNQSKGEKSLELAAVLQAPGVATIWVDLKPKTLELKPDQVREYLEEIGAAEDLRKLWAGEKAPGRWRENYAKHTKTFVLVGDPAGDQSWGDPVGMAFELVPEKDPTVLRAGDTLPIRLERAGVPVPDFPVGIVREGEKSGKLVQTDANGRVSVPFGQSGRWMLRATQLTPATQPELEWESHFTTLTVQVR